jgi:polyphosphate kinase
MTELRPKQAAFTTLDATADESGNPDRFVNREFSWLQFNRRVLEEARNERHPLLERVRFLSISAGNLDEFFMVRVAGLAGQVRQRITLKSPDGRTPEQQLEQVLREVERLQSDQQKILAELMARLEKEGIETVDVSALTKDEKVWLEEYFREQVFPVLTPLSIDPAHPFPFIPNLGFSMALQLRHLREGEDMSALLRLPPALKRYIRWRMWWAFTSGVCFPAMKSRAPVHSRSFATATSKSRKNRRIWCGCSKPHSSAAGAAR